MKQKFDPYELFFMVMVDKIAYRLMCQCKLHNMLSKFYFFTWKHFLTRVKNTFIVNKFESNLTLQI